MTERNDASTENDTGLLLVVSGPSGTGKTTICRELVKRIPEAQLSVSATTRRKRPQERDGDSYYFVQREDFLRQVDAGGFLEYAEYLGNLYGTPLSPVKKALDHGQVVILEIEVQGGTQVMEAMSDAVGVFIMPPTMETLKARLAGRETESARQMEERLAEVDGEIGYARDSGCYKYFVTNDELERTIDEIRQIIEKERRER